MNVGENLNEKSFLYEQSEVRMKKKKVYVFTIEMRRIFFTIIFSTFTKELPSLCCFVVKLNIYCNKTNIIMNEWQWMDDEKKLENDKWSMKHWTEPLPPLYRKYFEHEMRCVVIVVQKWRQLQFSLNDKRVLMHESYLAVKFSQFQLEV